jgi:aspartate aminotransferase
VPNQISRRVQRVKPSPTLAVTARAAKLKAEGKDIIGLGAGEPDFDTPKHIADAGVEAIRKGFTRYTNVDGIVELKDAIIEKFKKDNQISYERNQILVSSGAKQTIYNLCMAVLDPGDEAVVPAPFWVSYPDMVLLADGLPVTPNCPASQGYKLTPRQLEAAITPKTRLLLINSPCNPTGAAYTRAEWRALADVLADHPRVVVGTDDMYEKIWWGAEPFCSLLTAAPELYDRVVTINGVSKSYAMTGWRLGYCGGPKEIINAMSTLQGQSTSNACSITQKAAVAALTGDQKPVELMNIEFKKRHDYFINALNRLPGCVALPAAGAFYAWVDCSAAMMAFGCKDDNAFAEMLLVDAGVAVVAGSGFGAPGHFRASFATSMAVLEKSIERMKAVLERGPVAKTA